MFKKIIQKNWLILGGFLIYIILGLALYSPVLNSFFVSDDFDWVVRAKVTPHTFSDYFLKNSNGGVEGGVFRPLTSLSYLLDFTLTSINPVTFHLSNILFFLATALVIYWLIYLLTQKKWLAFFSGLFFIVLPNHPEAVSWISGRGDVLSAFFYILSLAFYVKFRQKKYWWLLGLSVLSFFFAVLAKEMGMSLPGIIILYELLFVGGWKKESWKGVAKRVIYVLPFVLVLGFYLLLRWNVTHILAGFYASPELKPSLAHLVRTLLVIINSNFLESYNRLGFASVLMRPYIFILLILAWLGFIYLILRRHRQEKIFLLGLGILIIGALPVLPLSFSLNTSEGDRFAYLPSIGLAIILGWITQKFFDIKRTKYLQFLPPIILIVFLSFLLIQKNWHWQEAGYISKSLLFDFGQKVDLQKRQGIVILAMPDNVYGAQTFRNGWFSALRLFYPNYTPDLLVAYPRLHITDTGRAVWLAKTDGFVAKGTEKIFHGEQKMESLDYVMKITGYDKKISSGDFLELTFSRDFLDQMKEKQIVFLAPFYDTFKVLELKK